MTENENVAARTPDLPVSLAELASSLLDEARSSDSGNAAITLTPGSGGPIKQTVVALRSGGELGPDRWNGPATLQVIEGRARVGGDDLGAGQFTVIEGADTDVSAADDLVVLLTVAPDATTGDSPR